MLHAWFALIGVSVLTTWQHHFIDLPTGALLGFFCLWLWPQDQPAPFVAARWTRDPRRLAIALRYAIGALAAAALAIVDGGAALLALWITVALALVALNYAWLGPSGFQKREGRLSPAAAVLLAPYLAGALVNAWAWTRARSPFDPVADDVWLGRMPSPAELERGGFDGVVDLTCEMPIDPRPSPLRQYSGARPHAAGSRRAWRGGGGHRATPIARGACSFAVRSGCRAARWP